MLKHHNSNIVRVAPAKLNLFLHVVGANPNGLHELETLVVFTELHDVISIKPSDELKLERNGPFAKMVKVRTRDDIVFRAATALGKLLGLEPHVQISLTKNIPVSAGLGGGSSDAAATIKSMCDLWNIESDRPEITRLAFDIGSDVPACLQGMEALVRGTGENITPYSLPIDQIPIVLVNPKKPLSTQTVFQNFSSPFDDRQHLYEDFDSFEALLKDLYSKTNSLTGTAERLCAEIKDALTSLGACPGCLLSRLSGSGPTCFGLFSEYKNAQEAAAKIALIRPNWWVKSTTILKKNKPSVTGKQN